MIRGFRDKVPRTPGDAPAKPPTGRGKQWPGGLQPPAVAARAAGPSAFRQAASQAPSGDAARPSTRSPFLAASATQMSPASETMTRKEVTDPAA